MDNIENPTVSSDTSGIEERISISAQETENLSKSKSRQQDNMHPEFHYNKHNESIFDDERVFPSLTANEELVKFDENNPDLINHATLKALLVQLTSPEVIDYNLICDFFLTYRIFVDSEKVMNLLLTRLIWSLQYINSKNEANIKIGKLVLLRTFVVLRHWIINYFIDDFESNSKLCDLFAFTINKITVESNLINNSMIFERKILCDLKIHWISLLNEFWKIGIDLEFISKEILYYSLPLTSETANYKKLSKSNTEMSIHTNPSYRRSAMLSLYDQKTQHKCIIFDDLNGDDENPQLSINNLLLQHQSSRVSLNTKLQEIQEKQRTPKNLPRPTKKASNQTNKHNHMNLKDSSLALKKTSKNNEDAKDLESSKSPNSGFSTNGNVKLPSSKVNAVLPPTPVKKMEYIIKPSMTGSPTRKPMKSTKPMEDLNDVGRKKSIKKLVNGWKKSFNHSKTNSVNTESLNETDELNMLINNAISVVSEETKIGNRVDILSARIIDELEYLIRFYIRNESSTGTILEDEQNNDDFVDVDIEDEKLADCDLNSIDIMSSPIKKTRVSRSNPGSTTENVDNVCEVEDEDIMDINDLSELNIRKIDNLINNEEEEKKKTKSNDNLLSETLIDHSKESSFQRPGSFNWNDEGNLNLENSEIIDEDQEQEQEEKPSRILKSSTRYFDVSSELPPDPHFISFNQSNNSFDTSISTPSNLTQYDDDVVELGIALSPQSLKQQQQLKRISFNESNLAHKRISIISKNSSSSVFKRDSIKSYISYDSAFSISNISRKSSRNEEFENNLKKKNGYNNLRSLAGIVDRKSLDLPVRIKTSSLNSFVSRSSSIRRSVRFSTLCALTELPFNNYHDDSIIDKQVSILQRSSKSSDLADSSIFSVAIKSRKNSTKTYNNDNLHSSNHSSTNSVAIPGISSYVLKELAAIPDESFQSNDPVEFTLYKLEGRESQSQINGKENKSEATTVLEEERKEIMPEELEEGKTKEDAEREKGNEKEEDEEYEIKLETRKPDDNAEDNKGIGEENEEFSEMLLDDTQAMLNEINNANTQDILDCVSEEVTQELPLTPSNVKPVKPPLSNPLTSNSNNDSLLFFNDNFNGSTSSYQSPKVILDAYILSNDILSVEKVIENSSHISFILSYDSSSLADHFTIIEKDMLQEIDWKELIELKWKKELTPVNSWLEIIVNDNYYNANKGVNLVISRFNLMVNWIISEILLTKTQDERINIISRFIHIAQNCFALQNYSTLMQIILALTSEKIQKLKETWKNLSPGDILMLKNLEELSSPLKNFLKIRLSINQMKPSKGCVPFVGLYLSDLIFNAERPTFVKSNNSNAITSSSPLSPQTSQLPAQQDVSISASSVDSYNDFERLINFSKFRTSVHIVKSLSQCIEWSSYYNIKVNTELLSKCLYIKSLDEDEMNICLNNLIDS